MWRDQVWYATKDAIIQKGEEIGMLQSGNLAGLILKVFQVNRLISCRRLGWPIQEAQQIGRGCISAYQKGRPDLTLSEEAFKPILSYIYPNQFVEWCHLYH